MINFLINHEGSDDLNGIHGLEITLMNISNSFMSSFKTCCLKDIVV